MIEPNPQSAEPSVVHCEEGDVEAVPGQRSIIVGADGVARCWWAYTSPLQRRDHDEVWGAPCYDGDELFARLCLECLQAGLSWSSILRKQRRLREVFHYFRPYAVARMEPEIPSMLQDAGIIRNRRKIEAIVANAQLVVDLQEADVPFADYLWQMVGGKPLLRRPASSKDVPDTDSTAALMSTRLRKDGFRFVGPTVAYAFMQASGMVNDHLAGCFRAVRNPEKCEHCAGGMVFDEFGRVALIGRELSEGGYEWCLPKGHMENDETPQDTAVREVYEETGILGEVTREVAVVDHRFEWEGHIVHKFITHFALRRISGELNASNDPDHEAQLVRWVPLRDLEATLTHRTDQEVIRRYMTG